ncbi:hypothetical protein HN954_00355 [bacterium]|nr:hypothetical protein [bacterium]MBT6995866.1 hypothetical protein [bacterium]MBT7772609.1 hypothetical protein [bacterium]
MSKKYFVFGFLTIAFGVGLMLLSQGSAFQASSFDPTAEIADCGCGSAECDCGADCTGDCDCGCSECSEKESVAAPATAPTCGVKKATSDCSAGSLCGGSCGSATCDAATGGSCGCGS